MPGEDAATEGGDAKRGDANDVDRSAAAGDKPEIRILRWPVRTAIRYTPLLVLAIGVAFVLVGEMPESIVALSPTLAPLGPNVSPLFVIALVVWLLALPLPLIRIDLGPVRRVAGAVGFYGRLGVLVVGTVLSGLLASSPETVPMLEPPDPDLPRTVLDGSGTLLVMFLGGTLVYDTMLRLENTFAPLPAKTPNVIDSPSAEGEAIEYADFLEDFGQALEARLDLPWVGGGASAHGWHTSSPPCFWSPSSGVGWSSSPGLDSARSTSSRP